MFNELTAEELTALAITMEDSVAAIFERSTVKHSISLRSMARDNNEIATDARLTRLRVHGIPTRTWG